MVVVVVNAGRCHCANWFSFNEKLPTRRRNIIRTTERCCPHVSVAERVVHS